MEGEFENQPAIRCCGKTREFVLNTVGGEFENKPALYCCEKIREPNLNVVEGKNITRNILLR